MKFLTKDYIIPNYVYIAMLYELVLKQGIKYLIKI